MRLFFALLVVVNITFLAWRYIASSDVTPALSSSSLSSSVVSGSGSAINSPVVSAIQSESIPPSALAAQTITLLEEVAQNKATLQEEGLQNDLPQKRLLSAKASDQALENPANTALSQQTCYWLGPFAKEAAQAEYAQRLNSQGVVAEQELSRVSGGWLYWVYLPAQSTRKEAREQLSVLQGMKVDSYLIQKGEKANGISLGLFSRKELADAKYQAIKAKGFAVEVDAFERIIEQRWLIVRGQSAGGLSGLVLSRMAKNEAALQLIEKKCELPVASHNNIH